MNISKMKSRSAHHVGNVLLSRGKIMIPLGNYLEHLFTDARIFLEKSKILRFALPLKANKQPLLLSILDGDDCKMELPIF